MLFPTLGVFAGNGDDSGVLGAGPGNGRRYRRPGIGHENRVLSGRVARGNTGSRSATALAHAAASDRRRRWRPHLRSCGAGRPRRRGVNPPPVVLSAQCWSGITSAPISASATRMAAAERYAPTPPPDLTGLRHHRGRRNFPPAFGYMRHLTLVCAVPVLVGCRGRLRRPRDQGLARRLRPLLARRSAGNLLALRLQRVAIAQFPHHDLRRRTTRDDAVLLCATAGVALGGAKVS